MSYYKRYIKPLEGPKDVVISWTGDVGTRTYYYEITVYNLDGESTSSGLISIPNCKDVLDDLNKVTLTWNKVKGAKGYRVYGRDLNSRTLIKDITNPDITSYVDNGLDSPDGITHVPTVNRTHRLEWDELLFREGKIIQSAELNDIQGISNINLQRLGDRFYNDGDIISGAQLVTKQYKSLQITNISGDFELNELITGQTSGTSGKLVNTDNNTYIFVSDYNGSFSVGETVIGGTSGNTAVISGILDHYEAYITDGEIYLLGKIRNVEGTKNPIVLTGSGIEKIGLKYEEKIITESDDSILLDPAEGVPNYGKPGAHRLTYDFTWIKDDPNMVEVFQLKDGKQSIRRASMSELEKSLARRTYDESGNYTVTDVKLTAKNLTSSKFELWLDPMKCYVLGYELEKINPEKIEIDRTLDKQYQDDVQFQYTAPTPNFIYLGNEFISDVVNVTGIKTILDEMQSFGASAPNNQVTLNHTPVFTVDSIWSGPGETGTQFIEGSDWERNGNTVTNLTGTAQTWYINYKYNASFQKAVRTKTHETETGLDFTTTNPVTLSHSDLIRVTDCYQGAVHYSEGVDFEIDNGQTDTAYNNATITWLGGTLPTNLTLEYDYWAHTVEGDYVSADSYDVYDEILSYKGQNLRDVIDFRTNGEKPANPSVVVVDFNYYLSRVDLVYIDSNGIFNYQKGKPEFNPIRPKEKDEVLYIAEIWLPPYIYSIDDVAIAYREPKRFTMHDIHLLEHRIDQLEYYQSLNQLENEANYEPTAYNKSGIFVDNFTGHSRGDVNHPSYNCSIDEKDKEMLLSFTYEIKQLEYEPSLTSGIKTDNEKLFTLGYTEEEWLKQPFATDFINVNPYDVFEWTGVMKLTPETDFWVDTERVPDIQVDFDNNNAGWKNDGWKKYYGSWRGHWTGWHRYARNWPYHKSKQFPNGSQMRNLYVAKRTVTAIKHVPNTVTKSLGDRVVDVSIIPYIRQRPISVTCERMRPDTDNISLYFSNIKVDFIPANATYQGSTAGTGKTDAHGILKGSFMIPEGVAVGKIKVEAKDDLGLTASAAYYTAQGMTQKKNKTILGITNWTTKKMTWTESKIIAKRYADPLAQTFLTPEEDYIFVSSIDLYFKTKSANIPVTVQIHTTDNGYPADTVLPNASKTLYPSEVNISDDGSAATRFTFDDLVVLQPGTEYSIVILANSNEYYIWKCTLGGKDISSGNLVTKQPYNGVFFKSQNASTWTADQNSDLKFKINRAKFQTSGSLVFKNVNLNQANGGFGVFSPMITDLVLENTNITYFYCLDGSGAIWNQYDPANDVQMNEPKANLMVKAEFSTNSDYVSPMINKERCGVNGILFNPTGAYVNFETKLNNDSNNIKLIVQVDKTGVVGVDGFKPYFSTSKDVSVDPGSETWVPMTQTSSTYIDDGGAFYEYYFENSGLSVFNYFRIKIDLDTNNRAFSPKLRKLRVITG